MEINNNLEQSAIYIKIDTYCCLDIELYNEIFYIYIKIYNDDNHTQYYSDSDDAAIIYDIKYDNEKCDMFEELEFGNSFKNFINSALNITLKLYPQIERFRMTDCSNKTCHSAHFKKFTYIDFNMYYLLFYGEPWFSKLFGARLHPDSHTQTYYNQYLKNINYPYDEFDYSYLTSFLYEYSGEEIATEYINKYNIEELYNQNSDSLYNFFQALKNAIGDNNKLREFLAPSFHYIMRHIYHSPSSNVCTIFGGQWFISADSIPRIDVDYVLTDIVKEDIEYFKSILLWEYNIKVRGN